MDNKEKSKCCGEEKYKYRDGVQIPICSKCREPFEVAEQEEIKFCGHYSERFEPCKICAEQGIKDRTGHRSVEDYCCACEYDIAVIEATLQARDTELVEMCKEKQGYKTMMSNEPIPRAEWKGYNQALEDIINLIKEKRI